MAQTVLTPARFGIELDTLQTLYSTLEYYTSIGPHHSFANLVDRNALLLRSGSTVANGTSKLQRRHSNKLNVFEILIAWFTHFKYGIQVQI